jgi:hypothetical protein
MANSKISGLTAATTPLAGTEEVALLQTSDKRIAVANFAAGAVKSNATTGIMQITGPAAGETRIATVPNVNFTVARTDAAQTFTGHNTFEGVTPIGATGTGNMVFSISPTFTGTSHHSSLDFTNTISGEVQTTAGVSNLITIGTRGNGGVGRGVGILLKVAGNDNSVDAVNIIATNEGANINAIYSKLAFKVGDYYNSGALVERLSIDNVGAVTMKAYGAGTATFSASGVISSVSDENYKIKDGCIENPFPMLMALETGYYYFKDMQKEIPTPKEGEGRQLGFYAQNVHSAIGEEAAPTPQDRKPWGYYDRSVLAVVVEALKELKKEFDVYKVTHP